MSFVDDQSGDVEPQGDVHPEPADTPVDVLEGLSPVGLLTRARVHPELSHRKDCLLRALQLLAQDSGLSEATSSDTASLQFLAKLGLAQVYSDEGHVFESIRLLRSLTSDPSSLPYHLAEPFVDTLVRVGFSANDPAFAFAASSAWTAFKSSNGLSVPVALEALSTPLTDLLAACTPDILPDELLAQMHHQFLDSFPRLIGDFAPHRSRRRSALQASFFMQEHVFERETVFEFPQLEDWTELDLWALAALTQVSASSLPALVSLLHPEESDASSATEASLAPYTWVEVPYEFSSPEFLLLAKLVWSSPLPSISKPPALQRLLSEDSFEALALAFTWPSYAPEALTGMLSNEILTFLLTANLDGASEFQRVNWSIAACQLLHFRGLHQEAAQVLEEALKKSKSIWLHMAYRHALVLAGDREDRLAELAELVNLCCSELADEPFSRHLRALAVSMLAEALACTDLDDAQNLVDSQLVFPRDLFFLAPVALRLQMKAKAPAALWARRASEYLAACGLSVEANALESLRRLEDMRLASTNTPSAAKTPTKKASAKKASAKKKPRRRKKPQQRSSAPVVESSTASSSSAVESGAATVTATPEQVPEAKPSEVFQTPEAG